MVLPSCFWPTVLLMAAGLPVSMAQLPMVCETSPIEGIGENPVVFALRQELTANDIVPSEGYGSGLSVQRSRIVVGDTFGEGATSQDGQAILYGEKESGGQFSEMVRFMPPDMVVDGSFGSATALWGDTLVVGAPDQEVDGAVAAGAVYIFARNNIFSVGGWVLEATFVSNMPGEGLKFGHSVAIYNDTVVVGTSSEAGLGQAMIFGRNSSSGEWVEEAFFQPGFLGIDQFGFDVSIHKDRVAVSSPLGAFGRGAVTVYVRTLDGLWEVQSEIVNPVFGPLFYFGASICLFENTLVVGAPDQPEAIETLRPGEAFVYDYDPETGWSLSQELRPPDVDLFVDFGRQVIAENGLILVGDDRYSVDGLENAGMVFAYTKADTEWVLAAEITAPEPAQDALFGNVMDMHNTVLGVTSNPLTGVGSVYVFALCVENTPTSTPSISIAPSSSGAPVTPGSEAPTLAPSLGSAPSSMPVSESPTSSASWRIILSVSVSWFVWQFFLPTS